MGALFSRPAYFINLDFEGNPPESKRNIAEGNLFVGVSMHGGVLSQHEKFEVNKPLYFYPMLNTSDQCTSAIDYKDTASAHQTFVKIASLLPEAEFNNDLINDKMEFDKLVDTAKIDLFESNLEDYRSNYEAKMSMQHYLSSSIHYHQDDDIYNISLQVTQDDINNKFIKNLGIFILKEITIDPNGVNPFTREKTFPVGTNLLLDPDFFQFMKNELTSTSHNSTRTQNIPPITFDLTPSNFLIEFCFSDLLVCLDKFFDPDRIYMPLFSCHCRDAVEGQRDTHSANAQLIKKQVARSEEYVKRNRLSGGRKKRKTIRYKINILKNRKSRKLKVKK